MRYLFSLLVVFILVGAGCTETASDESSSTVTNTANTSTTSNQPVVPNPNGVYNDSAWLARSSDGQTFTLDDTVLIEHASVPSLTRFATAVGAYPAGTLMIVYVDATEIGTTDNGTERTGRYVSTDNGETWSDAGPAIYVGAEGQIPVDPNLVQLPDGRLRMYYFDFSQAAGGVVVSDSNLQSHFYAADSTDGETFTFVGEVFSAERITDPEVVIRDGVYTLFFAVQEPDVTSSPIRAAASPDGLNFTEITLTNAPAGIPGAIVVDGEIQLFGCDPRGIIRAVEESDFVFAEAEPVFSGVAGICDPDPVRLPDESYLMITKKSAVKNMPKN